MSEGRDDLAAAAADPLLRKALASDEPDGGALTDPRARQAGGDAAPPPGARAPNPAAGEERPLQGRRVAEAPGRGVRACHEPEPRHPAEGRGGPAARADATPLGAWRADASPHPRTARPSSAGPSSAGPAAGAAPASSVTVLLALHQGAAHLDAQLASIRTQEGGTPAVVVSDDGSSDDGPAIARRHGARLIPGPRRGAAANFLHLLCSVGPGTRFASLSDQDDVWLPGKTARALAALAAVPEGVPAVHCGRTSICDAEGTVLRRSVLHARPPSFRNALVQSLAGGNTMTLNRAALDLLQAASREAEAAGGIVVHDWWIYQIVSGAGGRMIYDPEPLLLYRQHGANAIGENTTAKALARRAAMVLGGRFRAWSETNIRALDASRHRLTEEARATLDGFAALRRAPARRRLALFRHLGLYRQTRVGDAALCLAVLLGRI